MLRTPQAPRCSEPHATFDRPLRRRRGSARVEATSTVAARHIEEIHGGSFGAGGPPGASHTASPSVLGASRDLRSRPPRRRRGSARVEETSTVAARPSIASAPASARKRPGRGDEHRRRPTLDRVRLGVGAGAPRVEETSTVAARHLEGEFTTAPAEQLVPRVLRTPRAPRCSEPHATFDRVRLGVGAEAPGQRRRAPWPRDTSRRFTAAPSEQEVPPVLRTPQTPRCSEPHATFDLVRFGVGAEAPG